MGEATPFDLLSATKDTETERVADPPIPTQLTALHQLSEEMMRRLAPS